MKVKMGEGEGGVNVHKADRNRADEERKEKTFFVTSFSRLKERNKTFRSPRSPFIYDVCFWWLFRCCHHELDVNLRFSKDLLTPDPVVRGASLLCIRVSHLEATFEFRVARGLKSFVF